MPSTTTTRSETNDTLFQHVDRPDWGLAMLAWRRDDKRGFQFEDGELRVFKTGYFDRLQPVDRPVDESARVLAMLGRALGRERAAKRIGFDHDHPPIALADQLGYFSALFPKGFQGAKWAKQHRGIDARKHLKRHRSAAIQQAAELLTPERLRAHLDGDLAGVVIDQLRTLIDSTDLVTKAGVRGMDRIDAAGAERLVRALADLLADDSDVTATFDAWVTALTRALHRKPTWELATAIPALARPARFTAVKHSTFTRAAAWLAPSLIVDKTPSGLVYHRLLDMTDVLGTKLGEAGLRPRDLMDIYDFVQVTLCAKAIKALTATASTDATQAERAPAVDDQHAA